MKESETVKNMTVNGPFGFRINPPVFFTSVFLVILFVVVTLIFHDSLEEYYEVIRTFMSERLGWLYIVVVNAFVILCLYLAFGPYKGIVLGGKAVKPEFTYWQWFAMLFNAGIGLALMFYSLTEPMSHFAAPPMIEGLSEHSAQLSFGLTFLHWGIHGWAIYGVVGLAVAFFAYNRGLPLSLRSLLYPLIGDRIYGWMGHSVDILATLATLFGLATTLGIGIGYINSGLNVLFGVEDSVFMQIALIVILLIAVTISLVMGLSKGIKNLSVISAWLAIALVVYGFVVGPSQFILDAIIQNTGYYFQNFIFLGTWSEAYTQTDWQNEWTIFYWGWWFAWAPFVGIFVARISKGRTIKEFIGGVILAPTLTIIIWVTVFGGAGIYEELYGGGGMVDAINQNMTTAIYVLLERYPLGFASSVTIILVGCIFFVTSADSGSYVVDCITSDTDGDTPKPQRIFWTTLEGIIASCLIIGGGFVALQTASLVVGIPILLIMIPTCFGLMKELKREIAKKE
jgi:choline/glycine/proline betaine transport protein